MLTSQLDHITVTCASLEQGADFVEQALGVRPGPGGQHPRMGTHNLLLRLGDAAFLEVIAIDPSAPAPGRPRWFALDTLAPSSSPRLSNWVAASNDITAAAAAARAFADLGNIEPMSRGARTWRITMTPDGGLPLCGTAPALIAWDAPPHPASGMPDLGLSLVELTLHHPAPHAVRALLEAIGFRGAVSIKALAPGARPYLAAHIATPRGMRTLGL